MRTFLQAFWFLTILPIGHPSFSEGKELAKSMAFFPLVGLIIGLILAAGYHLFSFLFSGPLSIWLSIGLLAFLTRGLHLDGFADTMDGLGAGGPREKMLEVMRDSRIGTFGVIGLVLLIGGKYFALDQIPPVSVPNALIIMTVTGRYAMVLVCYRSPYARSEGGLAKPFTENLGIREITLSLGMAFGIDVIVMGLYGAAVFVGVGIFAIAYRYFFVKKLGGVTGDVLGGANELSELLCLLLIIILMPLSLK